MSGFVGRGITQASVRRIRFEALHYFQLFFQQLLVIQLGVITVALDQLVMRSIFNDFAVMKDGDTVGIPNSRYAVRDEYGRAALHDFTEVVQDAVFRVGVDTGESVVQDQNPRIAYQGTSDCRPLLLAARQRKTPFANDRVVALGEALDIARDAGGLRNAPDISMGCVFCTESDVLADRGAEEKRLLRYESDILSKDFQRKLADRPAIDQH